MMSRRIARLRPWLLGLGLACMAIYLWQERYALERLFVEADKRWLLISLPIAVLGSAMATELFGKLLIGHGIQLGKQQRYTLFFYSNLAKYIPGRIWSLLYQHLALPSHSNRSVVLSVNLDLMLWLLGGCTMLALTLGLQYNPAIAVGLAALVGVSLIGWRISEQGKRIAGRLFPIRTASAIDYCPPSPSAVFFYGLGFWSCLVASQTLAIMGLLNTSLHDALTLVGYLAAAWVAGTLALITPAGLGVREVAFVLLAQQSHTELNATTLALLAMGLRLWQINHELLGAVLVALVTRCHKNYPALHQ